MAKQVLHLAVNFKGIVGGPPGIGAPGTAAIEKELNHAADWLRYIPNCWLIYTGKSATTWHERLAAIPGMTQHSFFICELNLTNRGGWLPRSAWDWMKQHQLDH
ncbi:MAG TPA: hypothetical protein VEU62_21015 [Bryobacterales bacterium]|nr:hypothetical protein [Bryobacterales bacterium]